MTAPAPSSTPGIQAPDLGLPLYGASFGQAISRFWRRYTVFSGRASRSEFWWAYLANVLIGVVLGLVFSAVVGVTVTAIGASGSAGTSGEDGTAAGAVVVVVSLVILLACVALIIPTLAALARRFHDADQSALLLLLGLIPYVGFIPVLIIAVLPSDPRGARFDPGADPSAYWIHPPQPYSSPAYPQPQQVGSPRAAPPAARPAPVLGQPDLSVPPVPRGEPGGSIAEPASPQAAQTADPSTPQQTAADLRRTAWERVGALQVDVLRHLLPAAGSGPAWPGDRRAFVRLSMSDGVDVLASDGLSEGEDAGLGAEVYLALRRGVRWNDWRESLLVQTAQNLAHDGVRLGDELQRHGAMSMTLPGIDAPADWRGPDGGVGALLGIALPAVPAGIALPTGSASLVGVVPLRPDELRRIVTVGSTARSELARALSALSPQELTAPDRPSVV